MIHRKNFSVFGFSFSYFLHIIFELIVYVSLFPVVIWTYVFSVFFKFSIATRLQRYLQISVICEKEYKASAHKTVLQAKNYILTKFRCHWKATTEPSCKYRFVCCSVHIPYFVVSSKTRNNIFGIRLQFIILRVCLCERKMAKLVHLSHE
jgi:hypothetical protein